MTRVEVFFLATYFLVLLVLSVYGSHRYVMAYLYYKYKGNLPAPRRKFERLPRVTIQLPVFNEMYVVERLIDAVARIDYPRDLLEIQVLDDSTDETQGIARSRVAWLKEQGVDITYLHRENRQGFKAGALQEGLARARGELVAVFDADFVPARDFLRRSVHFFTDDRIGMVQVRWEHLNREYSHLTQAQAIFLDGHFVIEHTARNRSGRFFNFNGTAGVWRRATIEDAGGVAARHADRRPGPELPGPAPRLAVRLPAGSGVAGRSAGGDERVSSRSSTAGPRAASRPPGSSCRGSCAAGCRGR